MHTLTTGSAVAGVFTRHTPMDHSAGEYVTLSLQISPFPCHSTWHAPGPRCIRLLLWNPLHVSATHPPLLLLPSSASPPSSPSQTCLRETSLNVGYEANAACASSPLAAPVPALLLPSSASRCLATKTSSRVPSPFRLRRACHVLIQSPLFGGSPSSCSTSSDPFPVLPAQAQAHSIQPLSRLRPRRPRYITYLLASIFPILSPS